MSAKARLEAELEQMLIGAGFRDMISSKITVGSDGLMLTRGESQFRVVVKVHPINVSAIKECLVRNDHLPVDEDEFAELFPPIHGNAMLDKDALRLCHEMVIDPSFTMEQR